MLTPVKETGLAGARLAARVQQAMHAIPEAELRVLLGEIDRRARAEHLVYLRDEIEETIRVLATPITALPDQLAYVRAVALALHGALKQLPELYFTDPDVQAILALPALRARDPQLELESGQDIRALLMQDLLDHLEATGRTGRTVCFVEPKYAGYGPDEQRELARYIHAHFGIDVCHADPAELALDGDEVTYQGRVIDLVYRDYAVEDLLELEGEGVDVRPMQQAFATNRVVSSIAAELDQKSCWEVLGDPVLARRHFSSEDRAFFRRHLPWTRLLRRVTTTLPDGSRGDLTEYVLHAREDLVLKPNRSYGGTGVTIGPATDAADWEALVAAALAPGGERWVAQRLVPLPVCQFPMMGTDGRLHAQPFYVVYGFAPSAYGLATLGRASQAQVVNVAQRGGMCVLVVGHPPGQIVKAGPPIHLGIPARNRHQTQGAPR